MFKGERTWVFWGGLIIIASASIALFSILWNSMFTDQRSLLEQALDTGMSPRSIVDGYDWSFFQAYPWLSYSGRSYFQSDQFWKLLVPPIVGASTFVLIGLYMMKSGVKKEREEIPGSPELCS